MGKLVYRQYAAIIYTIALFLDRLDLTIVNITLPTMAKQFNISIVTTDWVSLAFLIAMAVSIPMSSWLGQRYGIKKYLFCLFFYLV